MASPTPGVAGFKSARGAATDCPSTIASQGSAAPIPGKGIAEAVQDAILIRRRLVVHGRVQGVAFRYATRERARALGIDGWVRNLPDGSVEAVFEGEPDLVAQLAAFCRVGPPAARVDRVEEHAEEPEGLRGFGVR